MRLTTIACSILLFSGLAAAQANIIGGTASDWAPPYIYAAPFVPLITTPSVSWDPAEPVSAGARNATWGNVAGARNSTAETLPPTIYNHAWYDSGFRVQHEERVREVRMGEREGHERNEHEHIIRTGIASSDFNQGLAQMVNKSSSATKASRTYTNQDVTRMNDSNGTVKYDGKTTHI